MWEISGQDLTIRQKIALSILKGHIDLAMIDEEKQVEIISNAFDFADLFIDMSREVEDGQE